MPPSPSPVLDTGASQPLVTNSSGYFEAPLLQPGNYQVTVAMTGFKTPDAAAASSLAVGQQVSVPFTLEVGQVTEEVTVTADSPLLDTSSVSSGQNFDSRMVEGLPMFSNMPIMLTRFAAGVNPSTNQSLVSQGFADGTTQAAGAAVGGVGSNNYSIDGATNSGSAPAHRGVAELRHDSGDARRVVELRRLGRSRHRAADFDDDARGRQPVSRARRTISTGRTRSTS